MTYPADIDGLSADAPTLYARFSRRLYALLVDASVYLGTLLFVSFVADPVNGEPFVTGALILLWLAFFMLYEPVLVSRRGATLGHRVANCRVIEVRTGAPPGFLRALARFWLKSLLGIFAFVFMALTRRHQALHDLAFGTAVLIADPERARPWHYAEERSSESLSVGVPAWRRIIIVVAYSIVAFLACSIVLIAAQSSECLEFERCTPEEQLRESIVGLGWLGVQAVLIVMGWKGRLLGARGGRGTRHMTPNPGAI
jgi:uncharacterized RDD family membrane protein YckC